MKVKMLPVNLQDGLLITDTLQVIGSYNHHHSVIIIKVPWRSEDIELPKELDMYKAVNGFTDNISLAYWRPKGQVSVDIIIDDYLNSFA